MKINVEELEKLSTSELKRKMERREEMFYSDDIEFDELYTTMRAILKRRKVLHEGVKKGDIVMFKFPLDHVEERLKMEALEDEDGGRVLVKLLIDMKIQPTGRYSSNDLKKVRS